MHLDLGDINGPVVVFGGPYSNAQATSALLEAAQGWPEAALICTGDVVAYGGAPARTVELLQKSGATVVAGNCEVQLASDADDCGCGFAAGSACDLLSTGWYGFARRHVDAAARAWMAGLPRLVSFRHCGKRYGVIHGGVTDIARFLWPVSPDAEFHAEWDALEAQIGPVDCVLAGHCGLPFRRVLPKGLWINAGVIGLPPNDGGQATRFAVLEDGQARFHRLTYDAAAARADMVAAGLIQGYHASLLSGYWPSEDILPPELRVSSSASG